MSVTELQRKITRLNPRKRRAVARYVGYLERLDSPAYQRRLGRIMREMDAGRKYTQAQVDELLARNPPSRA